LNIYGGGEASFDDETKDLASAFAGYAAVAVANAGAYARVVHRAQHLQRAMESRAVIDQAKGILMAQQGVSADAAFDLLSTRSQTSNRKLRDVARDIVVGVQRDAPR
jgi:AmiR/NasT family two-component response regulator